MPDIKTLSAPQRRAALDALKTRYQEFQSRKMNLDMTRGKPCPSSLISLQASWTVSAAGLQSDRRQRLPQLRRA